MSSVMAGYDIHNEIFLKWRKMAWQIECILSVHLHFGKYGS